MPVETSIRTRDPRSSSAPGCGLCATTMPAGSAEGTSNSRATKPALRTLRSGLLGSGPEQARHGAGGLGPDETLTVTVAPGATGLPGSGSVATTTPECRSDSTARKLSFMPRPRRRFSATGRGSPIRRGTTGRPRRRRSAIPPAPPRAGCPRRGSCLSTRPRGRALGTARDDGRRPAAVIRLLASRSSSSTTVGTLTSCGKGSSPRARELGCAERRERAAAGSRSLGSGGSASGRR